MIKEYKILKVYISDKSKSGQPFVSFGKPAKKVALKIEGIDGYVSTYPSAKTDDPIFSLKEGDVKRLIVWKSGEFVNFKIPTRVDELEQRVARLEKDVYEDNNLKEPHELAPEEIAEPTEVLPEDLPF